MSGLRLLAIVPQWWVDISAGLAQPWPRQAAIVDLRFYSTIGKIPGRRKLMGRWGWGQPSVEELLSDQRAWVDRSLPAPVRSPFRGKFAAFIRGRVHHRFKRSSDRPLYLDHRRILEVVAIARARVPEYKRALGRGWERDDLDQEILVRLLARQEEHVGYDGDRASVGKYLFVVAQGVCRNLLEGTETLKATMITAGATTTRDGERVTVDAAEVAVADWVEPCGLRGDQQPQAADRPRRGGTRGRRGGGSCA